MLFKNILILYALLSVTVLGKAHNLELVHDAETPAPATAAGTPVATFSSDSRLVWTTITAIFIIFL